MRSIPFFRYPDESLLGAGVGLRAAGRQQLGLRGEPAPRLRAEPGRLRVEHAGLAAHERLPGARSRGRPPRRDRRRDRRDDRRLRGRQRNGVVVPSSSLVTGYDFLADAADARADANSRPASAQRVGHADHAEQLSPQDPKLVRRRRALDGNATSRAKLLGAAATTSSSSPATSAPTARSPPTSRPACSRPTSPASTDGLHELDRVQRRLPLGLQHRRRRRASRRHAAARLGAGVRRRRRRR